ncbi:hypothetical protein Scep_016799 [Stephania cephalantha]|uniref:Uncharacterized protein n=1 Tax=Stephania cephalantha TaxID=152367 RepID=A0AAP0NW98_9MAGN
MNGVKTANLKKRNDFLSTTRKKAEIRTSEYPKFVLRAPRNHGSQSSRIARNHWKCCGPRIANALEKDQT